MKKKGIGLDVKQPKQICLDNKCPFHSSVRARGRIFTATVISDKMARTVTVSWPRRIHVRKYERYEKKRSRVSAHNPECINAKKGDVVRIAETRPLSKTKHFVVIQKTKKEALKEEAIEESEALEKEKQKPAAPVLNEGTIEKPTQEIKPEINKEEPNEQKNESYKNP